MTAVDETTIQTLCAAVAQVVVAQLGLAGVLVVFRVGIERQDLERAQKAFFEMWQSHLPPDFRWGAAFFSAERSELVVQARTLLTNTLSEADGERAEISAGIILRHLHNYRKTWPLVAALITVGALSLIACLSGIIFAGVLASADQGAQFAATIFALFFLTFGMFSWVIVAALRG